MLARIAAAEADQLPLGGYHQQQGSDQIDMSYENLIKLSPVRGDDYKGLTKLRYLQGG